LPLLPLLLLLLLLMLLLVMSFGCGAGRRDVGNVVD
jgi:hypothetical protein